MGDPAKPPKLQKLNGFSEGQESSSKGQHVARIVCAEHNEKNGRPR